MVSCPACASRVREKKLRVAKWILDFGQPERKNAMGCGEYQSMYRVEILVPGRQDKSLSGS